MPPLTPRISFPPVRIPQPDGSVLIKPGKARVEDEEISTLEFSRRSGISQRHIETLCEQGQLQHRRLTPRPKSKILIPVSELERMTGIEH